MKQRKLMISQKNSGDIMANKLTAFEKEQIECGKKIQEY